MKYRICLGIWIASVAAVAQSATLVPNPSLIGPIPATVPAGDPSHNYPYFSTTVNLAAYGYTEEEFFFEGTANRYNIPTLATGSVIDSGHPYRTRMVVRRPTSPNHFSGTVLMEWQNVTGGYDLDALWADSHDHMIRRGYAWIGVSAQRAGIHTPVTGLKAWSPSRYGTLDVTQGGAIVDDALCFDIFSQAAQAVRNPVGVDPMGGLHVERLIAGGASQSAARLVTYHNAIHPLAGVFDAFALFVGGRLLRTDLDVKVFKILSETDVAGVQAALRQPDSDHYRKWEVAGAAHLDFHLRRELEPLQIRDGIPLPSTDCDLPPLSRIPFFYVANAATDHMVRWVTQNLAPPTAPEMELVPGTITPASAVVARDSFGNALGGLRLSQHAVPTATNTGLNSGPGFCSLFGSYQPFDAATLNTLYPYHGTYVSQVTQAAHENLKDGYVVLEDAIATVLEAAQSEVGRH
jgi:hypothetical protein